MSQLSALSKLTMNLLNLIVQPFSLVLHLQQLVSLFEINVLQIFHILSHQLVFFLRFESQGVKFDLEMIPLLPELGSLALRLVKLLLTPFDLTSQVTILTHTRLQLRSQSYIIF